MIIDDPERLGFLKVIKEDSNLICYEISLDLQRNHQCPAVISSALLSKAVALKLFIIYVQFVSQ
jgi:hypothetical protein